MSTPLPCGYASEGQGVTPLAAALESGAMTEQGFDVTLAKMGDAHAVVAGLASGAIVFGNLAAPALVLAAAQGRADLIFLAGGVNQQFLVGAPGMTLESLRGQPLGMSHPGDLTDFLGQLTIDRVLGGSGELRAVGGSQSRLRAVLDGEVAATPLSPPTAVQARHAGCPWLYDYAQMDLNFAIGGIAATRSLVASEPELVRRFLSGYLEGQRRYKQDREFGVALHEKYGETTRAIAEETYDVTHAGFRDFPDPATDGMRMLVEFWKSTGVIPEAFHAESVVDSGPVTAVCGR
ncbi:MAG: ABC transporter substrate-binding protein [Chloroflexota bacterium]|nr:ABC transporter substrate-binding protein [Chloroflexota bacterium]MDE2886272.1 ABC transporter substrate-binding protein [Chloroflexota bacterium]